MNLTYFGACKTGFDGIAKMWFISIYFGSVQILPVSAFPGRLLGSQSNVLLLYSFFFLGVIFTSCVTGNFLHENAKAGEILWGPKWQLRLPES